jgi:protein-disulfide isomerase
MRTAGGKWMKLRSKALPPLIAAGVGLTACVDPNDIKEIKKNQKEILEKLDEISKKGIAAGPQRPAQPQPPRPDPNKVYAFEVGDSVAKGPPDAWVTIVEVSDFQ